MSSFSLQLVHSPAPKTFLEGCAFQFRPQKYITERGFKIVGSVELWRENARIKLKKTIYRLKPQRPEQPVPCFPRLLAWLSYGPLRDMALYRQGEQAPLLVISRLSELSSRSQTLEGRPLDFNLSQRWQTVDGTSSGDAQFTMHRGGWPKAECSGSEPDLLLVLSTLLYWQLVWNKNARDSSS